ncbi:MAG: ribosomal protein S18-alanine N-acetyltransferase [Myxococcota bacterium]|nr:ribosomal protein S18-alanine N-acetyltransferase [Myxococcota bacterium]
MPGTRITIRRAVSEDVKAIAHVLSDNPEISWSESQLRDEIHGKHRLALVGFCDGLLVGFCFVRVVDESAELLLIAIQPQVRRKGYASEIARQMEALLRCQGVREVFLEVRQSNEGAIQLYRELGYVQFGVRRKYYRNPVEDAILLKLPLTDCQPNDSGLD